MRWEPRQVWIAVAGGVALLVTLGLATIGWIPWVSVSIATVAVCSLSLTSWVMDRRQLRRMPTDDAGC